MQPVVDATGDLSTVDGLAAHTCSYLASVREAHAHCASRGYRNMRSCASLKKKAVGDICDMLVLPDAFTVLGYGDWSIPAARSIKRRFCGPNQEIKKELRRRVDSVSRCARLGVQDVGPGQQHVDADGQHEGSWSATGTDGWSRGRSRRFTR
jgi:hypothetical protein